MRSLRVTPSTSPNFFLVPDEHRLLFSPSSPFPLQLCHVAPIFFSPFTSHSQPLFLPSASEVYSSTLINVVRFYRRPAFWILDLRYSWTLRDDGGDAAYCYDSSSSCDKLRDCRKIPLCRKRPSLDRSLFLNK